MLASTHQRKDYEQLRRRYAPPLPMWRSLALAFVIGGSICAFGQIFMNMFLSGGVAPEKAGAYTAVIIVLIGAGLTGLGVYDEITRVAGMGAGLPISGFANSVASPALEHRREGWVLGVTAQMFTIAGPVLVYGLLGSMLVGIIYVLLRIPIPKAG